LTSLNLLKVAAADIRLLRKLFLRCRKPHAQATNVFAKLLLRFEWHIPHFGGSRLFESEV